MEHKEVEAFQLRLRNGQTWHIIGYGEQYGLARKLAHVMNLQAADANETAQQLIFVNATDPSLKRYDSRNVVFSDRQQRVRVWWQPDETSVHVEVLTLHFDADRYFALRMGVQMIHHLNSLQGGLPLHCALTELDGAGVVLAAKSGTGKTTCCQRFPDYWHVLGDDEALLSKTDTGFVAQAIPTWSHYILGEGYLTWQTEYSVPVRAIFFLEQAEQDSVMPLSKAVGGVRLYGAVNPVYHTFWKDLERPQGIVYRTVLFNNACDMVHDVPAFVLQVSRHGRFWQNIEEVLV